MDVHVLSKNEARREFKNRIRKIVAYNLRNGGKLIWKEYRYSILDKSFESITMCFGNGYWFYIYHVSVDSCRIKKCGDTFQSHRDYLFDYVPISGKAMKALAEKVKACADEQHNRWIDEAIEEAKRQKGAAA